MIAPPLALALTAGAAVALAACSAAGTGSGSSGGVLHIGTTYPIDSMNPFVAQSDYSYAVYEYIYPQLVQYNGTLGIAPDFARSWSASDGGRTWTFHTVPHAHWSDGKPLTAADVAWTINEVMKYKNGPAGQWAGLLEHMIGASAPNATTLVIKYSTAVANVLEQMQGMSVLPKQVWAPYFTGNGSKLKTYANTPPPNGKPMVSGGPFEMVQYKANQYALFKRNPRWWGPKPKIEGFGLQFFSNADAMVQALKDGQVDFIGEYTPPTAVKALKQAGFVVTTTPSLSMKTFIINTNSHKTTHRELLDPRVREAIEYATDRSQIIKTAWLGLAQSGSTIIAPADGSWHDANVKVLPFDLAKANKLLDAAGFKRGPNGVRIADGHPMSYNVIFPPDERGTGDRTFQIMQADLAKIGISISQQNMDDSATFNAISAPGNKYETFDMAMWDWVPPVDPDFMLSVMTCAQLGNNSDSGYCNPAYDKMYARQSTLIATSARRALIWKMQQYIYDAKPYIILDYPDIIEAHSTKWTGFTVSPVMGSVNSLSTATLLQVHQK
ncbi:MAG TPA: peptide ABC transporter substrate-binding protein [Streptosporangiaceae bacterium]|nr:peptide ABC transporter substrate-binding protein [Streptosporangiaceae bacterium]